jgi:hypothetical protein
LHIPLRIIVIDFVPQLAERLIASLATEHHLQHVDLISPSNVAHPPCALQFYDLNEIHFGDYDLSGISLPNSGLVEKMASYEAMALRCFDKLEKLSVQRARMYRLANRGEKLPFWNGFQIPYAERKAIYLRHLTYWSNRIRTLGVNFIICTNVPHVSVDYVIHGLAQVNGIPFITFEDVAQIGRLLPLKDAMQARTTVREAYKRVCMASARPSPTAVAERFINFQVNPKKDPTPGYMNKVGMGFTFHTYSEGLLRQLARDTYRELRDGRGPGRALTAFLAAIMYVRKERALNKLYSSIAQAPRAGEPYIYYAMHVQPEMSSAPLAGVFVDQVNAIRMLAAAVPQGMFIYVKEHPAQPALSRTLSEYYEIKALANVRMISKQISTFDLIRNAVAVATCTGTVGIESLFKEKPVLYFGRCAFAEAPGAYQVDSLEDCMHAVQKAIAGQEISLEQLRLFFCALESVCIPGHLAHIDQEKESRLGISDRDTLENVCGFVTQHIKTLKELIRVKDIHPVSHAETGNGHS